VESDVAIARDVSRGEAIDRALVPGILAGMVAAVIMGLFAAIAAATWRHLPASTPLREIAVLAAPSASQPDGAREPLVLAGALHLALGGLFGALFGLAARAVRQQWRRQVHAVVAGVLYGVAVMALMSALVLPAAGRLSGAGEQISGLPGRVGWPTFAAAHLLFGLALGLWVLVRPWDVSRAPDPPAGDRRGR
jgi:hypothetical protein